MVSLEKLTSSIAGLNNHSTVLKEVKEYVYLSKIYLHAILEHLNAVEGCDSDSDIMRCEIHMEQCQEDVRCKKAEIIKMGHEYLGMNLEPFFE